MASNTNLLLMANYDKLKDNGLVSVGEEIRANDILIGKTAEHQDTVNDTRQRVKRDASIMVKQHLETSVVDCILHTQRESKLLKKVKIRTPRPPQVGDKFTSRHGQKGVVGAVIPVADLPFGAHVPDLIINPHAIPSRMTLGHIYEKLATKLAASTGKDIDATPFRNVQVEDFAMELEKQRLDRYGNERVFDGKTGKPKEEMVFMGPMFIQRLKHQVLDKMHARRKGPLTNITRQPVEGRSRNGGLRFGEMERDCLISSGAWALLQDRMLYNSDPFLAPICAKCGKFACPPRDSQQSTMIVQAETSFCLTCETGEFVYDVVVPYSMKIFMQELGAAHLQMRMHLKGNNIDKKMVPKFHSKKPELFKL